MSAATEDRVTARCAQYVLNAGGLAALRDWRPPRFTRAGDGSITGIAEWDASTGVAAPAAVSDLPAYSGAVQTTYERYLAYRAFYRDPVMRILDDLYVQVNPGASLASRLDYYASVFKASGRRGLDRADAV